MYNLYLHLPKSRFLASKSKSTNLIFSQCVLTHPSIYLHVLARRFFLIIIIIHCTKKKKIHASQLFYKYFRCKLTVILTDAHCHTLFVYLHLGFDDIANKNVCAHRAKFNICQLQKDSGLFSDMKLHFPQ